MHVLIFKHVNNPIAIKYNLLWMCLTGLGYPLEIRKTQVSKPSFFSWHFGQNKPYNRKCIEAQVN